MYAYLKKLTNVKDEWHHITWICKNPWTLLMYQTMTIVNIYSKTYTTLCFCSFFLFHSHMFLYQIAFICLYLWVNYILLGLLSIKNTSPFFSPFICLETIHHFIPVVSNLSLSLPYRSIYEIPIPFPPTHTHYNTCLLLFKMFILFKWGKPNFKITRIFIGCLSSR